MGLDVAVTRRAVHHALSGFSHARAIQKPAPAGIEAALHEIGSRLARLEERFEAAT